MPSYSASPALSTPAGRVSPARSGALTPEQIAMIEEALRSLGDFGEVHLIVEKGRLRFLVTQKSFDALQWSPGAIAVDEG